jgi:hypothetical protein
MPDYYRTVNGNGVVHVNSSELVPFHPDYKGVNINMTNYNAFIKDDNTVTQDNENTNLNEKGTVEENCPNGGFNTYGTKDILENGNITTVQDT